MSRNLTFRIDVEIIDEFFADIFISIFIFYFYRKVSNHRKFEKKSFKIFSRFIFECEKLREKKAYRRMPRGTNRRRWFQCEYLIYK